MKKTLVLILAVMMMTVTACGGGKDNSDVTSETKPDSSSEVAVENKSKVNLSFEDAMLASGYIKYEDATLSALKADGTVDTFNGVKAISDGYLSNCTISREDIVRIELYDVNDGGIPITKDGKTGYIGDVRYNDSYEDVEFENVKDITISGSSGRDMVSILFNDGTVWSEYYSCEYGEVIPDVSNVKAFDNASIGLDLVFTHDDGTVTLWADSEDEDYEALVASLNAEVSTWTDIEMAVSASGNEYNGGDEGFVAGLKSDGTVVATGQYAELTSDWKDIVYLEAAYGILAGLSSDGRVYVVGECKDETIYENFKGEKSDPAEWENIIAISMNSTGYMVGLTYEGEVIGALDGSEGEKGYGPEELITVA